jgi:hypothetical protein
MKRIFILSVILLSAAACNKNALGGDATIEGKVMHHSKTIANASVFIKFNAKEFPGEDTSAYDGNTRADKDGHFQFKTYKGDYYLYAFGYDHDIKPPYYVTGGTPASVRSSEKVDLIIAVTEH